MVQGGWKRIAALLVSAACAAGAGCGGDDDDASGGAGQSNIKVGQSGSGAAGKGSAGAGTGSGGRGGSLPPNQVASSFASEHAADIRHDCQNTLQCLAQMGQDLPDGDPMSQCIANTSERLDSGSQQLQQSFLSKLERCRDFVACDYYSCVTTPSR